MFRTIYDGNKKQWSGPKTESIFNPRTSLGNVILNALEVNGSRVAQICANTNKQTTFAELHALTIRTAKKFQNIGFKKGQVVFFLTENTADVSPLAFAALCLGCVITSSHSYYTKMEYSQYFNIVRPNYVFCDLQFYVMLKECLRTLNIVDVKFFTFDGQLDESQPIENFFEGNDSDLYFVPTEVNGVTDTAYIFQTSGTSGPPKGVCISHAAILDKMQRMSPIIKSTDIVMGFTHFNSASHMRGFLATTLNGSIRVVNVHPYSPQRFFAIVEKFRVTLASLSTYRVVMLVNHPCIESANLFHLKRMIVGGSKLPYDVIQKMSKYLKNGQLCHALGITETVSTIAANLYHSKNDCVGQLISGCEAKIINEKGERQDINEDGELCIKLTFPFLRYLGVSDKTHNCFDEEGFFATGDIARFDRNGDLFIIGRKKEIFKYCSFRITPNEIEEFIDKIDGVRQSCVVPIPHTEFINLPAAVVLKCEESSCTEQFIYDATAKRFAAYKWLRGGIYFVDSMPLTDSGKMSRYLINKMAIEFYNNRENELKVTQNEFI